MISRVKQFLDAAPSALKSANEIYNFARNKYKQIMGVFPDGIDNIALKRGAAEMQDTRNKVVKFPEGGKDKEGVEKLIESGDITIGTAPKTTKTKPKVDPELQAMDDQNEMFKEFSTRIKGMSSTDRVAERLRDLKNVELSELSGIEAQKIASEVIGRKGPFKTISSRGAKEVLEELEPIIKRADADDLGTKLKNLPDDIDPDAMAMGGRIGMSKGGGLIDLLKFFSKKSPFQAYKDYLASVKRRAQTEPEKLAPELGAVTAGGIFTNRRMKNILEEGNELQKERLLEEFIVELDKDPFYIDRPELKDKAIEKYTETLFGEKRAMGGRIGFEDGGMSRRAFLKLMGGLASIPVFGKFFKGAKPAAKVAEVAKEVTSGVPAYFTELIKKIKLLGTDISETAATTERQKVTQYKGYELTEDLTTGKKEIKIGDAEYGKEEYMIYDPPETIIGKNNKPVQIPAQYDEVTVKPDMDGKMKDVDSGLDSYDEVLEEVRMKKSGGGVAYMLGE